jgi:hypothetical protein
MGVQSRRAGEAREESFEKTAELEELEPLFWRCSLHSLGQD